MQSIMNEISEAGLRVQSVSIAHLRELMDELARLRGEGAIGDGVQGYLNGFQFEQAAADGMETILVAAMPARVGQAIFNGKSGRLTALIPPTYMEYTDEPKAMQAKLNGFLGRHGYSAKEVYLPAKLLAARCGLAEYGRNNVCYVKGLGSFALLATYVTDMPCRPDAWQPPQRMELCNRCTACMGNCPTGAIQPDRPMIDGDRCLTLHNEAPSSVPFPAWIDPSAHNSLIGCMRCQSVCPANRDSLSWLAAPVEFDEAETAWLLEGTPLGNLPATALAKMRLLNMDQYYDPMCRNIQALYAAGS